MMEVGREHEMFGGEWKQISRYLVDDSSKGKGQ